jgi:hypothetical protein
VLIERDASRSGCLPAAGQIKPATGKLPLEFRARLPSREMTEPAMWTSPLLEQSDSTLYLKVKVAGFK